mmetsp:Transcript_21467/g.31136  ORF Transcript_21467/g.31136 Transcript_21467/m.31136 type:complete len:959 (+) Transcript_21467:110-2986(+)
MMLKRRIGSRLLQSIVTRRVQSSLAMQLQSMPSPSVTYKYLYETDVDFFQTNEAISYISEAEPVVEMNEVMFPRDFRDFPETVGSFGIDNQLQERIAECATSSMNETDEKALYQRQLEIEKQQRADTTVEAIESVKSLIKMGKAANLKSVQRVVLSWYEPLNSALTKEMELVRSNELSQDRNVYGPVLVLLPIEKITVITINTVINAILVSGNHGASAAKLAKEISEALHTEINISKVNGGKAWHRGWQQEMILSASGKPRMASRLGKQLRRYLDEDEWSQEKKLKIGGFLIKSFMDAALQADGSPALEHLTPYIGKNKLKKVGIVRLTESAFQTVTEESLHYGEPAFLPMVVPPRPWESRTLNGGYLTLKSSILRYRTPSQMKVLTRADMQPILDGLNYLGRIPWRINKSVYHVVKELYARGECIGEIPSKVDIPLPKESDCFVTPDKLTKKRYGKKEEEADHMPEDFEEGKEMFDPVYFDYVTKKVKQKNQATHSLRCDLEIKLSIAEKFKDDVIYYPWNLDFRGRAYPVPPNLSHLGSDMCRGLLTFAEGKPLGKNGFAWLKCHLCNLFGNNKISFAERVQWTEDHLDEVLESARNPLDGRRWWTTAENPFQALAACVEIRNAIESGDTETYSCYLPVHQDGSCNGLQHYAALGRDEPGGQAVNLLPAQKPQDVYSEVLGLVINAIERDCSIDENHPDPLKQKRGINARLLKGKVDRKVIKQTVMTSVYGVTLTGARAQILARLKEKLYGDEETTLDKAEDQKVFDAANYLANVTIDSLGDMFEAANEIMEWLAVVASAVATQGHVVSWITPLGLPVMQPYRKMVPHTVKTLLQSITLSMESDALPVSGIKQKTAFPPNYVHSLDSTHMLMTCLKMKDRNLSFVAVHDSFWTHACDVEVMNEELRNCFVELYSLPLLETLKSSLELRYPGISLPDVPKRGCLDISRVRESRYFFH